MLTSPKTLTLLLHCLLLFKLTDSERKSRSKSREEKIHPPTYEIHQSNQLPSDLQVTTFLYKNQPKIFLYWSTVDKGPLSATVITCSSPVQWFLKYSHHNSTDVLDASGRDTVYTLDVDTKHVTSLEGMFVLHLTAKENDTYVHIYMSTEFGGPQALQKSLFQEPKLVRKQRRRRLTVKWDPSLVDPQGTDYCLVVSTKKNHKSLCKAQSERYGIESPSNHPKSASQTVITYQPPATKKDDSSDPMIVCTKRKTQYTVSNLVQGQIYYFDVFGINKQSNLTYLHCSTSLTFDKKIKPNILKDGKATFVNMKKLGGKAVFKYKVSKGYKNTLELFIMPCGGAVDVEVSLSGEIVTTKRRIESLGRIIVSSPLPGARYYIKVFTTNKDELRKTSGVEVYATTKTIAKTPLPSMPPLAIVQEYTSLRRCDSVTVGWLSSPGQKVAHYCLVLKEGKIREMENYELPNQCGLENRLKKSADFTLKYCKDIRHDENQAVVETIDHLKAGKSYILQVTVKKPKGKTLSYDLLQIHTLPSCRKKH